jgi:hypothetical protein
MVCRAQLWREITIDREQAAHEDAIALSGCYSVYVDQSPKYWKERTVDNEQESNGGYRIVRTIGGEKAKRRMQNG